MSTLFYFKKLFQEAAEKSLHCPNRIVNRKSAINGNSKIYHIHLSYSDWEGSKEQLSCFLLVPIVLPQNSLQSLVQLTP